MGHVDSLARPALTGARGAGLRRARRPSPQRARNARRPPLRRPESPRPRPPSRRCPRIATLDNNPTSAIVADAAALVEGQGSCDRSPISGSIRPRAGSTTEAGDNLRPKSTTIGTDRRAIVGDQGLANAAHALAAAESGQSSSSGGDPSQRNYHGADSSSAGLAGADRMRRPQFRAGHPGSSMRASATAGRRERDALSRSTSSATSSRMRRPISIRSNRRAATAASRRTRAHGADQGTRRSIEPGEASAA